MIYTPQSVWVNASEPWRPRPKPIAKTRPLITKTRPLTTVKVIEQLTAQPWQTAPEIVQALGITIGTIRTQEATLRRMYMRNDIARQPSRNGFVYSVAPVTISAFFPLESV